MGSTTVRISAAAREHLKALADRENVPMQAVLDRAIEYYRRLADLEPDSFDDLSMAWEHRRAIARFNLGLARLRSGRPAEAVGDFQATMGLLGEQHVVLLQLGIAAAESGQLALAMDALERAVGVDADSAPAWIAKARVHRTRGETEGARHSYARALLLDPADGRARHELADLEAAIVRRP